MSNTQRDNSLNDVKKTELGLLKGTGRLLNKLPLKAKLILGGVLFGIIILSTLVSSLSIPQADKTFNITSQKEQRGFFNRPSEEEKERSLWDKEYTKEQTVEYLEVIAEFEKKDQEVLKKQIAKKCNQNGWDADESLRHLTITSKSPVTSKAKNSDTLIKSISLDGLDSKSLSTFKVLRSSSVSDDKLKLLKSDKTSVDKNSLYRYQATESMSDYLVAMPSSYGKNGSRFKAVMSDGTAITMIKAASTGGDGSGGIVKFIANYKGLQKKYKDRGDLSLLFNSSIVELSMIESEFSEENLAITSLGESILAAFSVYMDNGQTSKTNDSEYVNQDDDPAKQDASKVDYTKHLRKVLKKFLKDGGHFYEIDYERDGSGNINVRSKECTKTVQVRDKKTKKMTTVTVTYIIYYVCPILIEMDPDEVAEEIFGLDPEAPYVNSGGIAEQSKDEDSRINIRTAIDSIVQSTNAVIFEKSFSSDDIYLSGLGGDLEWPAPGITYITSGYGTRLHPILNQYIKHDGVDIGTPEGSKVVAANDGTVTYAGWYGNFGYYIEIDHGSGLVTCYGHLGSVGVSKGQQVKRGQLIAYSGNTGRSTGPHLHFQVQYNGATADPMKYIK